ncbi:MAG: DUF4382 domain-containing protein [Salinibacter sp.]|jgi:hypothetical protein|uniref:DUF4382 domain-containing protein n=1 Tax=Salinibacter sp. TaxID=2065818 RepID=UPI002FC299F2
MNRLSSIAFTITVAFGLLFAAAGCDSSGSVNDGDSGTLSLRMNDGSTADASTSTSATTKSAHTSISEALVTIDELSVVPVEDTSDGDSTETGISVLRDENFEVDLVDLQTGLDTTLAELEVPTGEYSQIRLVTADQASVTFQDGAQEDVMIASGQQTGLKVNFPPFTITSPDDRVEVTLNWNVAESLKGNPQGQLVITPVIDATVNTSSTGE